MEEVSLQDEQAGETFLGSCGRQTDPVFLLRWMSSFKRKKD